MAGLIDPDVFPAGGLGGADAGDFLRDHPADAHFLLELADGCRGVILTGIEVAGHAGTPQPRMHILEAGPLLEQKLAAFVENQHMHRAVQQLPGMHISPGGRANDLIAGIDHIKHFPGPLRAIFERVRVVGVGEFEPLGQSEFLATHGGGQAEAGGEGFPRRCGRQVFFELFAALGKAAADQFIKQARVKGRQIVRAWP